MAEPGVLGWRGGMGLWSRHAHQCGADRHRWGADRVVAAAAGAVAALRQLRTAGLPLALVTNTTSRPRASIASALAGAGFPVTAADILTAPAIAAAYLNNHYPGARCPVPAAQQRRHR